MNQLNKNRFAIRPACSNYHPGLPGNLIQDVSPGALRAFLDGVSRPADDPNGCAVIGVSKR